MIKSTFASRVAIVGGGISGLAAAHRLTELDPSLDIKLFESAARLGGVLETVRQDGFTLERSADNFITSVPWALDLCRRLGIEDQLVQTNNEHRQAFVVRKGRLRKIPEGFMVMAPSRIWPILTTPILSWWGKLRLAGEYLVRAKRDEKDESLASFATRRLGREVYQRLVQPLVGGIYTADPTELSVKATMPRFLEMEREHGGLIRAMWQKEKEQKREPKSAIGSGARYSMFVTPRQGLTSIVDAIASRLAPGTVRLNAPVAGITREAGRWSLRVGSSGAERHLADSLILATPAHQTARLLSEADLDLAAMLGGIPHSPCAIVSLGYRRRDIGHRMDGFGFVVPTKERRKILSGSFSSIKYPNRAPRDLELVRVFIGGACQAELAALPEDQLLNVASQELSELLNISGQPVLHHVSRWPQAMPQYRVGHCELIERVETRAAMLPNLELAGNAYHGVGVPNCIHSGEQAAEKLLTELQQETERFTAASQRVQWFQPRP